MKHDKIINFNEKKFLKEVGESFPDRLKMFEVPLYVFSLMKRKGFHSFYFNHNDYWDGDNKKSAEDFMNTAVEFFQEGVMDAPFESFIYIIDNFVDDGNGNLGPAFLVCQKIDRDIHNVLRSVSTGIDSFEDMTEQNTYVCLDFDFYNKKMYINPSVYTFHLKKPLNRLGLFTSDFVTSPNEYKQKGGLALGAFDGATLFLNTKEAEKTEKARESFGGMVSGGLPKNNKYRGFTLVNLRPDVRQALNDSSITGRKVRPHWRRGHVRRLSSGKITSVSPCIVNMKDGAPETAKYIVRK